MSFSNKPSSNGDKYMIELSEARVLFCTWEVLKIKVLTEKRIAWLEKTYGRGSAERIRGYMSKLKTGELE